MGTRLIGSAVDCFMLASLFLPAAAGDKHKVRSRTVQMRKYLVSYLTNIVTPATKKQHDFCIVTSSTCRGSHL